MRVSLRDNGQDGELGLDSEMECSLLEGQQISSVQTRASAFGEDPDAGLLWKTNGDEILIHCIEGESPFE